MSEQVLGTVRGTRHHGWDEMGLVIAQGIEAIDMTVFAPAPFGVFRMPLHHGLTVLYGENGAGKTTVLDYLTSALTGVEPSRGGEVHLHCRLTRQYVEPKPSDPALLGSLLALLRKPGQNLDLDWDTLNDMDRYVDVMLDHPQWEDGFDGDYWYLLDQLMDEVVEALGERYRSTRLRGSWKANEEIAYWDGYPSNSPIEVEQVAETLRQAPFDIITLVPVGSAVGAAWNVYTSAQLTDTAALRSNLTAQFTRSPGAWAGLLGDFASHDQPWFEDCVRLAFSPLEAWTPRVDRLGRIPADEVVNCLRPGDEFEPDAELVGLVGRATRKSVGMLSAVMGDIVVLDDDVEARLAQITEDANGVLHEALGPGRSLRFEQNHPGWWLTRGFGHWMVVDGRLRPEPLGHQGSAVRRWGTLALELSYRRYAAAQPLTLLIDEPENALHPAAQSRLADALSFDEVGTGIAPSVFGCVVASHSPALLAVRHAHLLQVVRRFDGAISLEPISQLGEVDSLVNELGVGRADVLAMTNVFVLVEGHHDEIVIRQLFRDDLDRHRARVVRMDGALNAKATLNVELLANYSAARLVLVIDKLGPAVSSLWSEALDAVNAGDGDAARRMLHRMSRMSGTLEVRWVIEAGLHAIDKGQFHRLRLVGLRRDDILDYLPVDGFVAGASSWDQLRAEWRASSHRVNFKDWLREHRGARITPAAVAAAAARMGDPDDLQGIIDAIR